MKHPRVIPVLLLKNEGLVKGVQFKNHRYVGDPINTVRIFNEKEVDEIVFLDIMASLQGNEPDYSLLERISTEAFMPFGYGGGIHKSEQAKKLFSQGVEKIVLGTAAIDNPGLIREIADFSGSQSVVVSVDVKKGFLGTYKLYSHSGTRPCKIELAKFLELIQNMGAGEIFLNSIDRDGTQQGYDIELITYVVKYTSVPVIVCGGAWTLEHIKEAVKAGADATAAGSMFVFEGKHKAVLITYPKYEGMVEIFNSV